MELKFWSLFLDLKCPAWMRVQGIREGPESNQCSGLRWPHLNGRPLETHFNPSVLLKGVCSGCSVEGLWHGCSLPLASLAAVLLDSWWCFLRWSAQIASHSRSHEQASGRCSVGLRISQCQEFVQQCRCWKAMLNRMVARQERVCYIFADLICSRLPLSMLEETASPHHHVSRVQVDEFQETAGMFWAISAFMIPW